MLYPLSWVSPSNRIDQSKTFCIQFAVFCGLGLVTLTCSKRICIVSILLILWPTKLIEAQVYFRSRPFLLSGISIGALSHRTGLPVSTIRFYDDNGLIQSNRNGGGHRRFQRAQIRRVSFIIAAQKFGYTLPQIKELLDSLPNERTPTAEDWEQLSEKFRESLDERIKKLQKLRDTLSDCIGCGCLSLKSCGLYNPQDIMGQDGPGPRRLDL